MVKTLKTNKGSALMKKLKKQGGFTLAELLIVVAIIAVLAAVAIPVYSAQMDAAARRVDESNLAAATSIATTDFLMEGRTATTTYYIYVTTKSTASASLDGVSTNIVVSTATTAPSGYSAWVPTSNGVNGYDLRIGVGGEIVASAFTNTP